jgi:hypothetical protein
MTARQYRTFESELAVIDEASAHLRETAAEVEQTKTADPDLAQFIEAVGCPGDLRAAADRLAQEEINIIAKFLESARSERVH